jgi:hypothetical protein
MLHVFKFARTKGRVDVIESTGYLLLVDRMSQLSNSCFYLGSYLVKIVKMQTGLVCHQCMLMIGSFTRISPLNEPMLIQGCFAESFSENSEK